MIPVLQDDAMLAHDPGPGHPERAERLSAIVEALHRLDGVELSWRAPPPATREQVRRVHGEDLVALIEGLDVSTILKSCQQRHMGPSALIEPFSDN